jgi:hypothetical protein
MTVCDTSQLDFLSGFWDRMPDFYFFIFCIGPAALDAFGNRFKYSWALHNLDFFFVVTRMNYASP